MMSKILKNISESWKHSTPIIIYNPRMWNMYRSVTADTLNLLLYHTFTCRKQTKTTGNLDSFEFKSLVDKVMLFDLLSHVS